VRPRSHSPATRIAEVLAELGLLHDDTTAAIRAWIDRRTGELPAGFGRDVGAWLVVLLDGDARARPRSHATLRVSQRCISICGVTCSAGRVTSGHTTPKPPPAGPPFSCGSADHRGGRDRPAPGAYPLVFRQYYRDPVTFRSLLHQPRLPPSPLPFGLTWSGPRISRGSAGRQDGASDSDPLTLAEYVTQCPKTFVR
jgi:hypothetical protein